MKKKVNYQTILLLILVTLIGLGAGMAGNLLSRQYLTAGLYNFPFGGELDLSGQNLNRSQVIIKGAKKITIEQNKRIKEIAEKSQKNLVGILKKENAKKSSLEKTNSFYNLDKPFSQGFIITTDGWIISEFPENPEIDKENIKKNYLVVDSDKKLHLIKKVKKSSRGSYWFLRLEKTRELPVKKIVPESEITKGDMVLTMNWQGDNYISHISDKINPQTGLVESSDSFFRELVLTGSPEKNLKNGFVFSLKGGIVGIIDKNKTIHSVNNFKPDFDNLLNGEKKKKASLGVNYIDLSRVLFKEKYNKNKGALIYPDNTNKSIIPDSPAKKANLKPGDIIESLNGEEVNSKTPLNYLVQKHSSGEKVNLSYIRKGESKNISITLE